MADLRTHRELTERGEGAVISALMRLGNHYVILPHLLLPGMLGPRNPDDLDVVVIGPMGAVLLEYRHWHGEVQLVPAGAPWGLKFAAGGQEERPNPGDTLASKAEALLEHLSANGVAPHAFASAVVVPDRTKLAGEASVPVIPLSGLVRFIEDALHGDESPWIARAADLLRPPTQPRMINQYRLTTLLRRQGDRTTYLAYDTLKQRVVVLHELPYDPYQRPDELERTRTELLREAKLTLEMQHPAIARIEQLIPQDDCYYVVGEWIDGAQSLRELVSAGPLSVEAALDMAIACADALSYAHGKGVVHRNVRPENILIAGRTVKVTDFRMAKRADLSTRSSFDLRQMVQENPYAAPEFRLGAEGHHRVDARADLYSLAAVLYEALTGTAPLHLDEKYWAPPSGVNPQVPPALDDTIQLALRFDPSQRLSTMASFRERLLAIREGRSVPQPSAAYVDRKLIKRTRNSLVFRATDAERQREVALKKLLLDPMLVPEARKTAITRLLREAHIAAALVHPRIVTVLDQFVEDEDPYVVMEWVDGNDLRDNLDGRRPALSVEEALDIVRQVGEALSYAHDQGVIHQDIKPENIMLVGLRPMLLDFGLAATPGFDPAGEEPGRTGGTPRYMPPETLRGGVADGRGDLFSLAVVLYELLTGRFPYSAELIMGRFATLDARDGVAPPSHLNLGVPSSLDRPILKALEIDPTARQASVAEFLAELTAAALEDPGLMAGGRMPWKALALSGAGALVVGAIAVVVYLGGPGLLLGRGTQLVLNASPSPEAALESPSPSPSVVSEASVSTALAVPSPVGSVEPTMPPETPAPGTAPAAPVKQVSWTSRAVTVDQVTMQVESAQVTPEGQTVLTVKVTNRSADPVHLLHADSNANHMLVTDDLNGNYSQSIDWAGISPELAEVSPGQTVLGTLRLTQALNPEANLLQIVWREDGGREFSLRAHRVESGN